MSPLSKERNLNFENSKKKKKTERQFWGVIQKGGFSERKGVANYKFNLGIEKDKRRDFSRDKLA